MKFTTIRVRTLVEFKESYLAHGAGRIARGCYYLLDAVGTKVAFTVDFYGFV